MYIINWGGINLMGWSKCKREECFANWLGICSCLTKSYPENQHCPFFKTTQAEYKEIKDDTYWKLQGAFAPQVLAKIMKEGKR